MLLSTANTGKLYLTPDLRAMDGISQPPTLRLPRAQQLQAQAKQFPPVEDVVAILDRIASESFIA